MLWFNASHGYLDAILRGYKSSLITKTQYTNFTQCESVEDLRVQLSSATDYAEVLQDLTGGLMKPSLLSARLRQKFVQDFRYLRCNASGDLAVFLDFICLQYMIDNVVMIVMGVARGEEMDRDALMEQCHPLGLLDLMPALTVSRSLADLYNTVLIETPLGAYFQEMLQSSGASGELNELNVEIIRLSLGKSYLEDFSRWCKDEAGSGMAEGMSQILGFEADRRTLNIALNAIGTGLPKATRLTLFPRIGKLYECGLHDRLAYADDPSQIRTLIESSLPSLRPLIDAAISNDPSDNLAEPSALAPVSFESLAAEREIDMCRDAFLLQFSLTPFYAWVRLAEQEGRNVVWIAECIAQGQKEIIHQYIPIF